MFQINAPFGGGGGGGVYFENFEKGGGAFKRRGRLIEVIRYVFSPTSKSHISKTV